MTDLSQFIVKAKNATYIGAGETAPSCRLGSHDLTYEDGLWFYRDSYFGGTDFLGQEVVWRRDHPIWAMNYYGFVLRPDLIDAKKAGDVVKSALGALYAENRFLGGYRCAVEEYKYIDDTVGDHTHFHGVERIMKDEILTYKLRYNGGLIKD